MILMDQQLCLMKHFTAKPYNKSQFIYKYYTKYLHPKPLRDHPVQVSVVKRKHFVLLLLSSLVTLCQSLFLGRDGPCSRHPCLHLSSSLRNQYTLGECADQKWCAHRCCPKGFHSMGSW